MLGVGLLCTSSTRVLEVPLRGADALVQKSGTLLHRDAEVGVIRTPASASARPVRLPAPGVFRVSAHAQWACASRRSDRFARTRRLDRRPRLRLITRRLRLPRSHTADDPDG